VVFTRLEVRTLLAHLSGTELLIASLLYGSGLRLMEAVRLRVKDIDFSMNQITVREGKGAKDRITMLPAALKQPLEDHLRRVRVLHEKDLREGLGRVYLPFALERKYVNASHEWGWQYVFPSIKRSVDPRSGALHKNSEIPPTAVGG
jgi:integrase